MKKLLSERRQSALSVIITYGFSLLAVVGTLITSNGMLQDCFAGMELPVKAILGITLWAALVIAAIGLQMHFLAFRGQRIVVPGITMALVWGGWWIVFDTERLVGGLQFLANWYLQSVNSYYGLQLEPPPGDAQGYIPALAFGYMVLISLGLALSLELRKPLFLALLPTLILILEMLVGMTPGIPAMGLFFLLMILFYAGGIRGLSAGLRLVTLGITLLILLLSGWIAGKKGEAILSKAENIQQFQIDAEKFLKEFPIGQGLFRAPHLDNQRPEFEDKKVLTVTCERAVEGKLYLREAFADNYWRGYWTVNLKPLEKAAKTADVELDGLWEEMADLLYQRTQQTGQRTAEYSVACEQFGSNQMYLPYGAHWEDKGEFSLDEQGMAQKSRLFATRSFQAPLSNDFDGSFGYVMCGFSGGGTVPGTGSRAMSWYGTYLRDHVEILTDQPTAKQIAEKIRSGIISASGNRRRYAYAQAVANYLKKQYIYSLDLEELPSGADAIEYFLSEGRKGYCMHFASAGVAILRHLGVPSRYASGYVIPKTGFTETEDGYTAEVLDSQAHAWVEIYLDDIGWVPVEMTPGYEDSILGDRTEVVVEVEPEQSEEVPSSETASEPSDAAEEENTNASQQEEASESGSQGQTSGEKEAPLWEIWLQGSGGQTGSEGTGGEGNGSTPAEDPEDRPVMGDDVPTLRGTIGNFLRRVGAVLFTLLKCTFVLAAILLILWGGRRLVRTIRRRKYLRRERKLKLYIRRGKYSAAAVAANRFLYGQLRSCKRLTKRPETDQMFLKELKERFPDIPREDWDKYYDIIIRAFYGQDEITREEAEYACRMYRE
ncbi:MAG: transglutaminase domain-containing protein [Acetatifactor sp.]